MRIGQSTVRGTDGRLADQQPCVELVPVGDAEQRKGVGRGELVEQQVARVRRAVLRRAVHGAHVVERTRPRRRDQRPRRAEVEAVARRLHGAAEAAVGAVVVEGRAAVAARQHHQRTVLLGGIVEQHAHGEQVVVGVRIEGPVLVPLHRRAVLGRLQVELASRAAARRSARAARDSTASSRGERMNSANTGCTRCGFLMRRTRGCAARVRRLEVVDVVVRRDTARALDQLGQHLLHALARHVVEQALDDDEAVATVLRQALRVDVGHASFLSLPLLRQRNGCANIHARRMPGSLSSTAKPSPASSMPLAPSPRKRRAPPDSVRMEDVARAAGVSAITVSRALNAPDKLAPATLRGGARGHRAAALRAQPDGRQPGVEPLAHRGGDRADDRQLDLLRHHRRPGAGAGAASLSVAARADELPPTTKRAQLVAGLPRTACRRPGADRREPRARRAQQLLRAGIPVVETWDLSDATDRHAGRLLEPCGRVGRGALSARQGPSRGSASSAAPTIDRWRDWRAFAKPRAMPEPAKSPARSWPSPSSPADGGRALARSARRGRAAARRLLQQRHAGRRRAVRVPAPPHRRAAATWR